jgi:hypothetical protein
MGMYRRSDVEGFAQWARTTIERLTLELSQARGEAAEARHRAADAERRLTERDELQATLIGLADGLASAAAQAAVGRIETLLDEVRARRSAPDEREPELFASRPQRESRHVTEAPVTFDDPVRDPLPLWDERLVAFPDEHSELPPIGPIFEPDTHRTA